MKKLFSTLLLSALAWQLQAAPAEKCKKIVTLLNGETVEVSFWGDEYGCFYMDQDGRMLEPVGSGERFRYASYDLNAAVQRVSRIRSAAAPRIGANLNPKGTYKVPVVLVQFKDKTFSVAEGGEAVNTFYDKYCNGTKDGNYYTGAGSFGAVRDYFAAQSDSTLFWDFDIIGPVTLDKEAAYYGQDQDGKIDVNIGDFYTEALTKALSLRSDWSVYDSNADGMVDMVFFLYAGLGQANGGSASTIWPKETNGGMTVGDLSFAVSACCNELRPIKDNGVIVGGKADGIGIMCHEMSHVLGLPDFYNAEHNSFGMDYWSVMDYGYFTNNGYNPGSYNGYERDFMGWRSLVELKEPQTVRMKSLEEGGVAYKIVNDQNPDEYYVLHNMQPKGWDVKLSTLGHGMLVTHVDYDTEVWNMNLVNEDMYHQRMTIVPANNKLIGNFNAGSAAELLDALAGHPYPGKTGNTELTDASVPAAEVYRGEFMGKPIKQVEEHDGVVTFKFMPLGVLATPVLDEAVEKNIPYGLQISWPAVEHAEAYRIEYKRVDDLNDENIQCVDSVKNNSVALSGLSDGVDYCYRVMALADKYENSAFAAWKTAGVTVNSINDIPADDTVVEVYNLQGIRLLESSLAEARKNLREGLYVVKSKNFNGKLYLK